MDKKIMFMELNLMLYVIKVEYFNFRYFKIVC